MKIRSRGVQRTKLQIFYSLESWDLGLILLASTEQAICAIQLGSSSQEMLAGLSATFPQANIRREQTEQILHAQWFEQLRGLRTGHKIADEFPLLDRGTKFQQQVWQTLQQIPYGQTRTYSEIAHILGKPAATRAVGSACGANPWALVVPCHRVVRSDGGLGGYRWGVERKQKLLELEAELKVS